MKELNQYGKRMHLPPYMYTISIREIFEPKVMDRLLVPLMFTIMKRVLKRHEISIKSKIWTTGMDGEQHG